MSNRFGELAEHLVAPGIMEKFNDLGFNFTRCAQNVKIKVNRNIITEIDILLENGDTVIAVEVKAKPDEGDIEDLIEKMEKLCSHTDRNNDKRRYMGAVAGAIMKENIRRQILKKGFFVIEQSGDTMKINIPEEFVPREW